MVPLANLLVAATGTWTTVLLVTAVSSLGAGALAKLAIDPMRRGMFTGQAFAAERSSAVTAEPV
jgi:hypothetical protein